MAQRGQAEKAKGVLRAAARRHMPELPNVTLADVEAAIVEFERGSVSSPPSASAADLGSADRTAGARTAGNSAADAASNGQHGTQVQTISHRWVTQCECKLHQAPTHSSAVLRVLPEGQTLIELEAPRQYPGWIPCAPRGWVERIVLAPVQSPGETPASTAATALSVSVPSQPGPGCADRSGASQPLPGAQAKRKRESLASCEVVETWHGKRPALPKPAESQRATRRRLEQSTKAVSDNVYILDALNILKHRNDERPPAHLDWTQLMAAGQYYKDRGKEVLAFLRRTGEWKPQDADVRRLTFELGDEFIVRCPPGACDDEFMITYAQDCEEQRQDGQVKVRIVTNDLFRDHVHVDASWVQQHTIKYTFAAGRFVPQLQA